jgi:hypothetical protein
METSEHKLIQTTWPPEETDAGQSMRPTQDFVNYVRSYAREKPETAALICLVVGFVLGWKLKIW